MKLDIGCGGRGSRQEGFIGIDLCPRPVGKTEEEYHQLDFAHDDLPWKDGTVDEIIALHVIEHMTPCDGAFLITRAYDLLKPDAEMTITCPDLKLLVEAYMDEGELLRKKHLRGGKEIWPGHTLADRLNWAIHQDGHKWAYDEVSLYRLIERAIGSPKRIRPVRHEDRWSTRPDHEVGYTITKR